MSTRGIFKSALRGWKIGALALVIAGGIGLMSQGATAQTSVSASVDTIIHATRTHVPLPCFAAGCAGQVGPAGSIVHDKATIVSSDPTRTPTGIVIFALFVGNLHCKADPESVDIAVATGGAGVTTAESSNIGPLAPGEYSYKAVYVPDAAAQALGIGGAPAKCEQLQILQ